MCKVFYYKDATFLPQTGELSLTYAVDRDYLFTEKIVFPNAPFRLSPKKKCLLDQVLDLLHIAAGISYYKAFLPEKIEIKTMGLTREEATFFDRFYLSGLGEFAVRNNLNLQGKIHFPYRKDLSRTAIDLNLPHSAFIPVGGGKDSCVTMELIKQTDLPATAIAIGNATPIQACMEQSHLPFLNIERRLDPKLIELNKAGKTHNGHVPITGILAFVLWMAAILYDKKYVVMSCERSANVGNLNQGELSINHQYSKSFSFEQDFYRLTQTLSPDFRYFSLLRPISEVHIAKLFSKLCAPYFPLFTSCNKAFKLNPDERLKHWCGHCDKCRFVFLILAPFINRQDLIKIIGCNPLDDETQLEVYRELLGLSGHKPFECVGEISESRWAFQSLAARPEWQNDIVIKALIPEIRSEPQEDLFLPAATHLIPEELSDVMDRFKQ